MITYVLNFSCRTIDSLAVGYGKGKLTCFLGDLKAVVDAVSFGQIKPQIFRG